MCIALHHRCIYYYVVKLYELLYGSFSSFPSHTLTHSLKRATTKTQSSKHIGFALGAACLSIFLFYRFIER